jgi:hypothetical protein
VKDGKAIDLGGNGYPCFYTALAEQLIPRFIDRPPNGTERGDPSVIDRSAALACPPNEWLLVVAWDMS